MRGLVHIKRNDYQNSFLQYIAEMQEARVEITLGEHGLYDREDCDEIRKLLLEATHGMIYDIMEMIDGYSSFTSDKMDIVNTRTGKGLKSEPFIELHDDVCDFIKYE